MLISESHHHPRGGKLPAASEPISAANSPSRGFTPTVNRGIAEYRGHSGFDPNCLTGALMSLPGELIGAFVAQDTAAQQERVLAGLHLVFLVVRNQSHAISLQGDPCLQFSVLVHQSQEKSVLASTEGRE